jgi:hypothetical protein
MAAVDLVTLDDPGLPDPDLDWNGIHASTTAAFVAHVLERMS